MVLVVTSDRELRTGLVHPIAGISHGICIAQHTTRVVPEADEAQSL
ncbi:MAG: hypothetical protein AB1589_05105 [Cyanobacteriota bacterium]